MLRLQSCQGYQDRNMAGLACLPASQECWACKVARIAACKVARIAIWLGLQACQGRNIAGPARLPGLQLARLPGSQYCWACKAAKIAILLGLRGCQDRNIAGLARLPSSQYCWACKVVGIAILLTPLTLLQAGKSSCTAETSNEHVDASNGHTDEHVDLARSCTMKEDILAGSHGEIFAFSEGS